MSLLPQEKKLVFQGGAGSNCNRRGEKQMADYLVVPDSSPWCVIRMHRGKARTLLCDFEADTHIAARDGLSYIASMAQNVLMDDGFPALSGEALSEVLPAILEELDLADDAAPWIALLDDDDDADEALDPEDLWYYRHLVSR